MTIQLFDYLLINMTIPTHKYHVLQWKGYIKVLCNMYIFVNTHISTDIENG